ncbi:MAG TPA: hypothetical protein VFR86_00320 [Burkholderiaceae bacterium]|nr:hypothetical protein [Burkholderiaceae bacterium]
MSNAATFPHATAPQELLAALRAMANTPVLAASLRTRGRDGPVAPVFASAAPITIAWGEHDRVVPCARYGAPFRAPAAVGTAA